MFKFYPLGGPGQGWGPCTGQRAPVQLGLDETGLGFEGGVAASWMGLHLGPQEGCGSITAVSGT